MKRTLLNIVQSYLNSVSGFPIDSIHDTTESYQVAVVAQDVYYSLVSKYKNLQTTQKVTSFNSSLDVNKPTIMSLSEGVHRVQDSFVRHRNEDGSYSTVKYLEPQDFLEIVSKRRLSDIGAISLSLEPDVDIVVFDNLDPMYCTSFNGREIVFDSFDKSRGSTLQHTDILIVSEQPSNFLLEDSFVIPLPPDITELYLDMVKAEASEVLLQEPLISATRRANSGLINLQQDNHSIGNTTLRKQRYGRRR